MKLIEKWKGRKNRLRQKMRQAWKFKKKKWRIKAHKIFWKINPLLPKIIKLEKRGATCMKRIEFDEIIEILNGIYREGNEKKQCPIDSDSNKVEYLSESKTIFENAGLENHIVIESKSGASKTKTNNVFGKSDDTGYNIMIKNLIIVIRESSDIKPHPYFSRTITFKNNTFICPKKTRDNSGSMISYRAVIDSELLIDFGIKFQNNIFKNVHVFFDAVSNIRTTITLIKNIFKGGAGIQVDDVEVLTYKTSDNSSSTSKNKASLVISDNEVPYIFLNINSPIHFGGQNKIGSIEHRDKPKNQYSHDADGIYWGPYQKISNTAFSARLHRQLFIALKEIAIKNNDKMQEVILNREILRCDHSLIKLEPVLSSWQDRIIMWFGEWSSNHGIKLFRPIILLLLINAFLTSFVVFISAVFYKTGFPHFSEWLSIWGNMLDPRSYLSQTLGSFGYPNNEIFNAFVSIINAIQKVFFALLTYESIRVGRRFVAK